MIDIDNVTLVDSQKIEGKVIFKMLQGFEGIHFFTIVQLDVGGVIVRFQVEDVLQGHEMIIAIGFNANS